VIKGIGVDIVCLTSINSILESHTEDTLRDIYTEAEIELCRSSPNSIERFATRFAAKEATMKALGLGWESEGLDWTEIEVTSDDKERPILNLHGKAKKRAADLDVKQTWISLSHEENFATAMVLLEG
jgi:holo-[acyl-carrier protein] synthase